LPPGSRNMEKASILDKNEKGGKREGARRTSKDVTVHTHEGDEKTGDESKDYRPKKASGRKRKIRERKFGALWKKKRQVNSTRNGSTTITGSQRDGVHSHCVVLTDNRDRTHKGAGVWSEPGPR